MPQPWAKPGTCRLVCSERRKSRPFTPRDVAKVIRYAKQAGSSEWVLLGAAFAGVGRAEWICHLGKLAATMKATVDLVASIGGIFAVSRLASFTVLVLRRVLRIPIPLRMREKIVIWATSFKALRELIDSTPIFSLEAVVIANIDTMCLKAIEFSRPEDLKDAQTKP